MVKYSYDSWGKLVSITGSMADTIGVKNPFRYRGYYYDTETGLYYLQSRYYDPEVGRFVNADDIDVILASPSQPHWDKNLFAYCDNNPVIRSDDGGEFWHIVAGAIIGGGFEIVGQLISGKPLTEINWAQVGIATVSGGVTAALGPLAGAAVSGITSVTVDVMDGKRGKQHIGSFAIGAGASLIGSGVGKVAEKLGGKIAVKQLSKMSKTQIKSKVTKISPSITGAERNAIKDVSYLVKITLI